jgi:hypothetical protein
MKKGHDTVQLKRGITAGGVTYTTVKLRVVPYMTEQQIKQDAEILERTPSGEWVRVASQETYNQMMLNACVQEMHSGSGKFLRDDLAREAFMEADGLHGYDAQRIADQLHTLNVIDMAEFGIVGPEELTDFLNDTNEGEPDDDRAPSFEKRDTAGAAPGTPNPANPAPAGGLQLEADYSNE